MQISRGGPARNADLLEPSLLSQSHLRHDLSFLKYITYGSEVMPEATLKKLSKTFPGVKILQKYGMTEAILCPLTIERSFDKILPPV
jgi:acyl-CoA synthetase (AMP-forming)/AMP-acid ligase II